MRRRQPETLLNKSFTAVVQLIVKLSRYSEAIESIHIIVETLPHTLVDEFTSMVIPRLKCPSVELLQSCLHPAVRSLDMSSWKTEVQERMCAVLPRLEHLRNLSISRQVTNLWFSTHLVSFSYPVHCTDDIIQDLAQSCKSLQVLSIPQSSVVTDDCVCFLLHLQQLQDLNVTGLDLTDKACARLLFGLPKLRRWQGGYVLKKFFEGLSESLEDFTSTIMNVPVSLAHHFPNLTHVSVTDLCVPEAVTAFATLEHLKHFSIGYPYEYDIGLRQFLDIHGENLLTFCVHEVLHMDFLHVVTVCPQLKTLQLEDCFISFASMGAKSSLPHFQSVEKLEVIVFNEEWLSLGFEFPFFDYSNLQHLVAINVTQIDDTSLRQAIIEKDWLRELRTLELRGTLGHLSIRSFMQLLKHCPYLESVSDLAAWPGVPQEDLESIINVSKQKNLDINIIAYPDSKL